MKFRSRDLNPDPYFPYNTKFFLLWSDYHAKFVWWSLGKFLILGGLQLVYRSINFLEWNN